jgi:hypothetical protein
MLVRGNRWNTRGGLLLDLVLAAGTVLIAAFLLTLLGLSFAELLSGAGRFFGL